jgi:signal peptidase II
MKLIPKTIIEICHDRHFWGNLWRFSALIAIIVIVDQWSKSYIQKHFFLGEILPVIPGFFNITHIYNPGAAFGFLANATEAIRRPLFLFLPLLACLWLVVLIWQTRKNDLLAGIAYSLIFAGAIGNLIDRFSLGHVIDFIQVHWKNAYFPAFNVADSSITIAVGFLIVDMIQNYRRQKKIRKK